MLNLKCKFLCFPQRASLARVVYMNNEWVGDIGGVTGDVDALMAISIYLCWQCTRTSWFVRGSYF